MGKTGKKRMLPVLLAAFLFCTACGGGTNADTAADISDETEAVSDLSGIYTDRLGTADIYSKLELTRTQEDLYRYSLSLYRLALLEGAAVDQGDGTLHFTNEQPRVEGEITIRGEEASVKITASDFPGVTASDVYSFPDGPAE